ncbi:hypothetical protein TWF970_005869 [Orbilia oligospora]|uniref:Amidoligase enzyme n=1 Tax=Orbilia oligospora TaxID=2813651 RepID=A0A7C8VFC9_ORBOL|nr:hypothetical protein TWF970_005869 [Orbilia oligospora]
MGTFSKIVKSRVWKKRGAVKELWKRKEEEGGKEGGREGGEEGEGEEEGRGKEREVTARGQLKFGIELELRLKPKPELELNSNAARAKLKEAKVTLPNEWDVFAETLKSLLSATKIEAVVNPGEGEYGNWGIKTEGTIGRIEGGFFPVEIVSPKLSFLPTPKTHPMSELATVWKCLGQSYDVDVNEKCSTHIHFSLLDRDWELDDLQSLAKAILMLDPLINRLFPDRQYKKWCRANTFSCTP